MVMFVLRAVKHSARSSEIRQHERKNIILEKKGGSVWQETNVQNERECID